LEEPLPPPFISPLPLFHFFGRGCSAPCVSESRAFGGVFACRCCRGFVPRRVGGGAGVPARRGLRFAGGGWGLCGGSGVLGWGMGGANSSPTKKNKKKQKTKKKHKNQPKPQPQNTKKKNKKTTPQPNQQPWGGCGFVCGGGGGLVWGAPHPPFLDPCPPPTFLSPDVACLSKTLECQRVGAFFRESRPRRRAFFARRLSSLILYVSLQSILVSDIKLILRLPTGCLPEIP